MNGRRGEAGGVDWELLADHLGGALPPDGADAARVAELIATDPAWAAAAAELTAALAAVAAELRALPDPGPMPAEVATRLDAALRAAGPLTPAHVGTRPVGTAPAPGRPAGTRHPGSRSDRPRRSRRIARWSGGVAVAAGLVAFAALGLGNLVDRSIVQESDGGSPAAGPQIDSPADGPQITGDRVAPGYGDPMLLASGMDYQQRTLVTAAPPGAPGITGDFAPENPVEAELDQDALAATVPPELHRLWTDLRARADCLAAVATSFAPREIRIDRIDFARFLGEPALVMTVAATDGTSWVAVTGPGCGLSPVGPDLRLQLQVS